MFQCLLLQEGLILFFFFQAEDGIRDYKVTGVQTCALPIPSMTSRYRPSRENPRPWTSICPLYIAPRTSASTSMRGLPSAIVPSTLSVFGLITLTVLEDWSAVYTRSFAEIGCAPGNAGACVTCSCGGWVGGVGVADEDPEVSSTPSAAATIDAVSRPPTIQVARRFWGRADMRYLSLLLVHPP